MDKSYGSIIKETLQKQLQLLSERSLTSDVSTEDLIGLSIAMATIAKAIPVEAQAP